MTTAIKSTSVLAFALALSVAPLVAFGQADSDDQGAADTSSGQSSKTASDAGSDANSSMSGQSQDSGTSGDEQDKSTNDSAADSASSGDMFIASQADDEWLSANLVGAYVNDADGNNLGSVQNVLLDADHKVRGFVVGVGGVLGIGAKSVAIDLDEFEQSRDEDGAPQLTLSASKEQLQDAPAFKSLAQQKADKKAKAAQEKAKQNMQDQQQNAGGSGGSAGGGTAN